jgi:hypothetical protein
LLKIKVINSYITYKNKHTSPKHSAIAIIPKIIVGPTHNGAVTHHQDHVIYPVSLRTKNTINNTVDKLKLPTDIVNLFLLLSLIN